MENILECTGLTKDYKGLRALDHLTFSVPDKGCIVGLLGPNGSGKTTLIKLLTGLLTPTEGNIRVGGMTVGTETKAIVAYLPDSNFLSDGFTVKQEVEYYKDFFPDFDEKKAEKMISELGVNMGQKVRALSKGTEGKTRSHTHFVEECQAVYSRRAHRGRRSRPRGDYILNTIVSTRTRIRQ